LSRIITTTNIIIILDGLQFIVVVGRLDSDMITLAASFFYHYYDSTVCPEKRNQNVFFVISSMKLGRF